MTKIGRNALCPCGSAKKYKRCCGRAADSFSSQSAPSAEMMQRMGLELRRREAQEHQRRLMQGLGRPIISWESNGFRLVAVGNQVRWSKGWKTFTDFLFDFIRVELTPEWGNAELAKPEAEQHRLIDWYRRICLLQQAHVVTKGQPFSTPMTGAVRAYLGLAYDLYLSAHNAELPERLLRRLRNPKSFEGALYEAFVIGTFAKAGFSIVFEDEEDPSSTHCEFTATHKQTGRKFSVEAKAVASSSPRSGTSSEAPWIRNLLYKALGKAAAHERIIFIELNRAQKMLENGEPDWALTLDSQLAKAEAELTVDGQPAPPAYLFITNRAFMHTLDAADCGEAGLAHGFKIQEFPQGKGCKSFLEAVEARDRHKEMHWLLKAMSDHTVFPSTFDDRLPEEVFADEQTASLQVGNIYIVKNENDEDVPGVLCDGTVVESERKAYGVYQLADKRTIICTVPLTDAELARYRRSPDTFFGVLKSVSTGIKQPLDMYDFLYASHSRTPKEKLLELMAGWPEFDMLKALSQPELAKRFCAGMAESMWSRFSPKK